LSNGTHRACDAQDATLIEKLLHIHALHSWKKLEQECGSTLHVNRPRPHPHHPQQPSRTQPARAWAAWARGRTCSRAQRKGPP
jgi:hypothetical protein